MPQRHAVHALAELHDGLQQIVGELASEHAAAGTPKVQLSRPADERFGDFATNVALLLAPVVRSSPHAIAQEIAARATDLPGVDVAEVAGPGFVNLRLHDSWFAQTLSTVGEAGSEFGGGGAVQPQRINLEFVSSNPTGPTNAASARHAAYGDSLARLLRFAGHDVATEYYVNDAGRQVELFGQSIKARAIDAPVPEDGYQGEYVRELAVELGAGPDSDPEQLAREGIEKMVARTREALESFRVRFDRFQSERELHDGGDVERGLQALRETGQTYERDGALWLRTTAFGDDKDRVLVRENGFPTYYAADVGYLVQKFARGFERLILVLGADHHGYVARLKAAAQALGHDPDSYEITIMQMVHLLEMGEQRKMSKRRGDIVTIGELVDTIGVDAARYWMVQRSHDQTLELDLQLAAEQTAKNPVYYVQYAHARICSILRKAAEELPELMAESQADSTDEASFEPSERRLIKRLSEFPVAVTEAAERRAPQRMAIFAHELASDFSQFYKDCRVIGEGISPQTTVQRLRLARASRDVIARALDLVGVHAPEAM